jgi:sugar lactone lactonase YvrE
MRYEGVDLTVHADLGSLAPFDINDMCVDRHGNAFVGQFGYDIYSGHAPAEAALLGVRADGSVHEVADGLRFANGMVITADESTLLVAESWGKCIKAFDLAADGTLANQRVWAELPDFPDGIAIDDEDGVWIACPVADRFVRVVEGGEVTRVIETPGRHAIACEVGGAGGDTLFMLTAGTHGGRVESQQALAAAIDTARI